MSSALDSLVDLLDLEELEVNIFRGRSPQEGWQRVFGGQVLGQALVAASRTVEQERVAHSLHGYFLRPGDPTIPILYQVALKTPDGMLECPLLAISRHSEGSSRTSAYDPKRTLGVLLCAACGEH